MNSPIDHPLGQIPARGALPVNASLETSAKPSTNVGADPTSSYRFAGLSLVTNPSPSKRLGRCGTGPLFLSNTNGERCRNASNAPTEGKIGCGSRTSDWRWRLHWGWRRVVTRKDRVRSPARPSVASVPPPSEEAQRWELLSVVPQASSATTFRQATASEHLHHLESSGPDRTGQSAAGAFGSDTYCGRLRVGVRFLGVCQPLKVRDMPDFGRFNASAVHDILRTCGAARGHNV